MTVAAAELSGRVKVPVAAAAMAAAAAEWAVEAEGAAARLRFRAHQMHLRRLRPEPRIAIVHGFLSADEARRLIELAKASGALHPSRVVNHDADGANAVQSSARTSESCKLCAAQLHRLGLCDGFVTRPCLAA